MDIIDWMIDNANPGAGAGQKRIVKPDSGSSNWDTVLLFSGKEKKIHTSQS